MNWETYLVESKKTSIYSDWCSHFEDSVTLSRVVNSTYSVLGLIGEMGELVSNWSDEDVSKEDSMLECSDVCWYYADISRQYNIDLIEWNEGVFDGYSFVDLHDDVIAPAMRVANIAKKVIRDGEGVPSQGHIDKIEGLLTESFNSWQALIFGMWGEGTFQRILQMNIDKLNDRMDRGTIKGSGDHR